MAVLAMDVGTSRFFTDARTREEPQVIRLAWWRDKRGAQFRLIKPPPGTTIDRGTIPYHGATLADLERDGIDGAQAVKDMEAAAVGVTAIVTFNSRFHWTNLFRLMGVPRAVPPTFAVDAMELATPIMQLPLMRPGGGFKSPSLREACRFFDLPEPALADEGPEAIALSTVRAVMGVYKACLAHA